MKENATNEKDKIVHLRGEMQLFYAKLYIFAMPTHAIPSLSFPCNAI